MKEKILSFSQHIKAGEKAAYSAREVQELFSTAMSQPCHICITEALKPHHTPFHDVLACGVHLAWSAASLRDYSLLYYYSSSSIPLISDPMFFRK